MSALSIIESEAPIVPEPAPAVAPVVQPQPSALSRIVPLAAVALAVVASFLSVVGLVVASRTVAGASLVVADARERQAQLAQVGALIEEVDALRVREEAALERMARLRSIAPATPEDINRAIDGLKQDLVKHEPDGGKLSLVRAGQAELAERIGQIALKLERIEQKLSASPKANPAAGRAPIS